MTRGIVVFAVVLALSGCGFLKQTIKTAEDLALLACELFASEHGDELAGMSAGEWCAIPENLEPFIRNISAAQETAGAEVGIGKR